MIQHSRSVVYSPDGTRLAVVSTLGIWLFDSGTGEEVALLQSDREQGLYYETGGVSFSPDGRTLASCGTIWDRKVWLWDVASGQLTTTLEVPYDWVTSVSFSPDGRILASGGKFGILLWDLSPYATPIAAVESASPFLPAQTALLANYPNPFNSRTWIAYRLALPGLVRLELYNALGQGVRTLVDQFQAAGEYRVPWDARDRQGARMASGVYLARLQHPAGVETRRLLYLE